MGSVRGLGKGCKVDPPEASCIGAGNDVVELKTLADRRHFAIELSGDTVNTPQRPQLMDNGFASLLEYFQLERRQPLAAIPHPDRSANKLIIERKQFLRQAAVLIPVTRHSERQESQIVLTVRSENLKSHAGQISFPGGSREDQDNDPTDTALRETAEEIGVEPDQVEVLGKLGDMALPSGFLITPIVGLIDPGLDFSPCPREVTDIFQIPLALAMDPEAYRSSSMQYQGVRRTTLELTYEDYRIWGATAAILFHLASEIARVEN